jgi:hypothetical protein
MRINTTRLEEIIREELRDLRRGPHCDGTVCLGQVDGMQVHLHVTKEEDDFIDGSENDCCIQPDKPALPKEVHLVHIIESERGWGQKIEDVKEFNSKTEAEEFITEYNSVNDKPTVPDWYMMAKYAGTKIKE